MKQLFVEAADLSTERKKQKKNENSSVLKTKSKKQKQQELIKSTWLIPSQNLSLNNFLWIKAEIFDKLCTYMYMYL